MSFSPSESAIQEYLAESDEIIQRVTHALAKIERSDFIADDIDSLYRDIHTLKGSSQLFGYKQIGVIAHAVEASLEPVRKNKIKLNKNLVDIIYLCIDIVQKIIREPLIEGKENSSINLEIKDILPKLIDCSLQSFSANMDLIHGQLLDIERPQKKAQALPQIVIKQVVMKEEVKSKIQIPTQAPIMINETFVPKEEKKNVKVDKPIVHQEEAVSESSTIRVQVAVLDKLMNLTGEMVLTRNQVLQYAKRSDDNDFISLTQKLDLVTSELQDSVMRTRMQPIGTVFSKFQRVIRDLAKDLGKEIDLSIQGADTELDKSLIEAIKDPLTHIIRNSCDHGLETAQERKKTNKKEQGTIFLKAYHEGGQVIIEVRDDGRGLVPEKILEKALEKKIVTEAKSKQMTTKEIQELIFAPGFSTAVQVSSVSGRGVGMDVVKTNVEKVGGVVELNSLSGQGTSIKLRIPLTLAIVPAMIVRTKKEFFAIPQIKLQELIRVEKSEVAGKIDLLQGKMIYRLRGELLPLENLSTILSPLNADKIDLEVFNIVVLKTEGRSYGLIVDEICDTADIVVKPLPMFLKKLSYYSGATIMGDGQVALILDTQGIADVGHLSQKISDKDKKWGEEELAKKKLKESSDFLLFQHGKDSLFAFPLTLVNRLEEFSLQKIEHSGSETVVLYRDSLLPLIELGKYLNTERSNIQKEKVSVVVISKRNRVFGLVVDEIVDILSSDAEIIPNLKESNEILGTIISPDKHVVTLVNALAIIDSVMGFATEKIAPIKLKKSRVLFAEDTIFFVKQVRKILEEAGLEVTHAPDGKAALDIILKSSPDEYSLLLSDIEMPHMNGFDLAKNVRADKRFEKLPMIALTTRFKEVDVKLGKEVGFNYYLEKLKSDELIETIKSIFERV
ncbi:MAG: chemotaxis protein CheW [Bacteriovoracaceae bacterium]